eukprot:SAG31_NODE_1289_length_8983_cov_9.783543_9_plen_120_part_00
MLGKMMAAARQCAAGLKLVAGDVRRWTHPARQHQASLTFHTSAAAVSATDFLYALGPHLVPLPSSADCRFFQHQLAVPVVDLALAQEFLGGIHQASRRGHAIEDVGCHWRRLVPDELWR